MGWPFTRWIFIYNLNLLSLPPSTNPLLKNPESTTGRADWLIQSILVAVRLLIIPDKVYKIMKYLLQSTELLYKFNRKR